MRKLFVATATVASLALLVSPSLAARGDGKGQSRNADSTTRPSRGVRWVYSDLVMASANPGGENVYVSARWGLLDCTYVFAAYYPVLDGQASSTG